MPCYHPMTAYRSAELNPTGKRSLVFNPKLALVEGGLLTLPCGHCIGCRQDRAQAWSIRVSHEAKLNERNCFLTLTYSDEHVPQDYSVKLDHYQGFLKRLRRRTGERIRFLGCGEYGDDGFRPHYHFALMGFDFADKKGWSKRGEYQTWKSGFCDELWPFGHHELGSLTRESGGYVARYIMKKMFGDRADDHYTRVSPIDGETYRVREEFCTMSRRPGLGSEWFDRFGSDAFSFTRGRDGKAFAVASDFVVVDGGRKVRAPRFYFKRLAEDEQAKLQRARKRFAVQPAQRLENTAARRRVREAVHRAKLARLGGEL